MDSPLALYRRYRPETFAEVIGQEHVTEPLRAALSHNRVNHAYLFSGPRGCGKTTSARILARALNCALAPVADPCGECDSCRDLARGGSGSIDVIEIDAASHGGVDDARDLREKAFFAPVRDRYKVYIIDEAHMVTTQGFNALLKLVEEPPPHLRFIFATTEPEKVIPTIRSRTHHYPFRLIPPRSLSAYLTELCEREGVAIEPAALPLVVRAGAGSARDTLSVLDQLLGGAGPAGVTYDLASGLLGYTPDTLLDEVVDAFAAGDGAAVFGVVDKVIETGQDPRRFTEDLLRRLRDLVIIAAVPDAPATGLIDVAADQAERLVAQASRFGRADLSRAADLVALGLTEMRGATAPRLLLELVCARVLLPGADHGTQGVQARLDRLERRVSISPVPPTAPATGASAAPAVEPVRTLPPEHETPRPAPVEPAPAPPEPVAAAPAAPAAPARAAPATPEPRPTAVPAAEQAMPTPPPRVPESFPAPPPRVPEQTPARPEPAPAEPAASAPDPAPERPAARVSAPGSGLTLVDVRRLWPDIIEATKQRRRITWIHLSQNSQVVAVDGATLTLGFANAGARDSFEAGGSAEIVRQAVIDVIGADWRIETIIDPGATADAGPPPTATPAPQARREPDPAPAAAPAPTAAPAPRDPAPPPPDEPPAWLDEEPEPPPPGAQAAARGAIRQTRPAGERPRADTSSMEEADAAASPDDLDADADQLGTDDLLARELGAQVIEEIPHQ
ncbi:DNA polymerase III subunit gamma and tau [Nocardioides litoris]|uniref:DNA polymerase III subunit gamma and tau n=1 Tax=Nocardioides litoris TaxID=1926648 RepID=UPI00111F9B37|nr:DNA polymerase III subunit gamma and tau [Nocardioides litoris]